MTGELVRVQTKDGIQLTGFYKEGSKEKNFLIHMHGYAGTFFGNQFVHTIAQTVTQNEYGFLTVETRGSYGDHGFKSEKHGYKRYGGDHELLEEAYLDIDAWVNFALTQGYTKVVLQGHSLATFKLIRYLMEGVHKDVVARVVLLAPFDKEGWLVFQNQNWKELKQIAEQMVAEGRGEETIPAQWRSNTLSYQTFLSWYKDDQFNQIFSFYRKPYQSKFLQSVNLPILVIVGAEDEYLAVHQKGNYAAVLHELMGQMQKGEYMLLPGAKHSFRGQEQIVAERIQQFLAE